MNVTRRQMIELVTASAVSLAAPNAGAQAQAEAPVNWPTKPVAITVGYAPGGALDGLLRFCTEYIQKRNSDVTFVIEYKPGASGNIAAEYVSKLRGDGHQFLMSGSSTHAANATLYKQLAFDPEKDFTPVAALATVPYILLVNPTKVPVNNYREFVDFVKARPGKLSYGSSAITGRLAGELLKQRAGLFATFIPYRALGQVVSDVIGGHLDFVFGDPGGYLPHVRSGRLRALAVSTRSRIGVANDIPTLDELGVKDFDVSAWLAVWGKAGTSPEAVQRFNRLLNEALTSPEGKAYIASIGLQGLPGSPDNLLAMQRRDTVAWAKIIRTAGIVLE